MPPLKSIPVDKPLKGDALRDAVIEVIMQGSTAPWEQLHCTKDRFYGMLEDGKVRSVLARAVEEAAKVSAHLGVSPAKMSETAAGQRAGH